MLPILAGLFLACLPGCLFSATMFVIAAGYLTRAEDQPGSFRMFAWMLNREGARQVLPAGILVAVLGLGMSNLAPVAGLVARKNGVGPVIAELVYVVLVVLWTANVIAAIRRSQPEPLPTDDAGLSDLVPGGLLEPLASRCARSGLAVAFEPEFVEWLKGKLVEGAEPPRSFVDRVVAPALLASAPGPGKYSATVVGDSPVLVLRHDPKTHAAPTKGT
jgi:hypothetical protein